MIFQCLIEQEYRNALMFSWSGGTLFSEGILFRLLLVPDTRTALKNIISHFFFFAKKFGGRFILWRLWWWWERVGLGGGGGLNTFYICLCPRARYLYDHWFKTLFLFLFLKKTKNNRKLLKSYSKKTKTFFGLILIHANCTTKVAFLGQT